MGMRCGRSDGGGLVRWGLTSAEAESEERCPDPEGLVDRFNLSNLQSLLRARVTRR